MSFRESPDESHPQQEPCCGANEASVRDRIAAELRLVESAHNGVIPARAVVDFARDPKTALHSQFTWDDGEAAEKWRLEQARRVIRSVKITFEEVPKLTFNSRVSLPSDRKSDDPVYRPLVRVMNDAEQRAELVEMVREELRRLRRKYASLTELESVWNAIDEAGATETVVPSEHKAP